ncbi:cyclophilin-like fold protein [Elstera cyanobacteriorum]|uniref:cyclophilin-like fold protein n=1 Tax=Elstera cyanobacteriorum TaxID=2022747 RepID=UPI002356CD0C|nr:cyclophilin-like fold protein [Elstera cyanobacteriorum]MCK6441347.1 MFS transporter [Elstera cyanobacteriorum]
MKTSRRTFLETALIAAVVPSIASASGTVENPMQIKFSFNNQIFTATLNNTPTALDLLTLLPLNIQIEDYSTNEKIAYLPRKLTVEGSGPFGDEAPGDLCYYAPWGNLALFYAGYRYSSGLIRLGRLDGAVTPLLQRGNSRSGLNRPANTRP